VFVGVVLTVEEVEDVRERLWHGHAEATAYVVGVSQHRPHRVFRAVSLAKLAFRPTAA